jgi:hypothetical protein
LLMCMEKSPTRMTIDNPHNMLQTHGGNHCPLEIVLSAVTTTPVGQVRTLWNDGQSPHVEEFPAHVQLFRFSSKSRRVIPPSAVDGKVVLPRVVE